MHFFRGKGRHYSLCMQFCPDVTVSIFTHQLGECFSYNLDHSFHSLSMTRKFQICGSDHKPFSTTFTRFFSERLRVFVDYFLENIHQRTVRIFGDEEDLEEHKKNGK